MPGLKTTLVRFTDDPKSYQEYIDHLDTFFKRKYICEHIFVPHNTCSP